MIPHFLTVYSGKIVNFAGWLLPVQYREAIAASHQHTRSFASLFDVGHMMQTRVTGKDAGEYLESLTTCDLKNMKNGVATLTVFTNDNGGILDDLIISKDDEDNYFVVSNAGRRDEDSQLLLKRQVRECIIQTMKHISNECFNATNATNNLFPLAGRFQED